MIRTPRRTLVALVAAQLLLSACSVTAQAQQPPQWPQQQSVTRSAPNFHAPSATHCSRPVTLAETPAWSGQFPPRLGPAGVHRERAARAGAEAESSADSARAPIAAAAPVAKSAEGRPAADAVTSSHAAGAVFAPPAAISPRLAPPPPPQPQQQPHPSQEVTAGVVDDNADFSAYLNFRNRTRVQHRQRDVRERYLLEVKDAAGRGVSDAEVAVQSQNGFAMWARTDAAGRAWLHPNAFDPAMSHQYDVTVRKEGRHGYARLDRGQRSSVEVRLDARAALPQARLDLVFLIDATGSMADEIQKLKATLRTIVGELAQLPSRPDLCLGLVAYRDRGDAFLVRSHDFTNDVGAYLNNALMPLHADGGGDYPEAMNEALHETVHRLSWRGDGATRLVVLLADAPPHLDYGAPHYDDDMMAALGKGIKIFSVGASGLDKQGEYIQRQIAQYTGGKFVFLTYADRRNPSSGPGRETVHDVKNYSVETLDRLVVRLVTEELGQLARN